MFVVNEKSKSSHLPERSWPVCFGMPKGSCSFVTNKKLNHNSWHLGVSCSFACSLPGWPCPTITTGTTTRREETTTTPRTKATTTTAATNTATNPVDTLTTRTTLTPKAIPLTGTPTAPMARARNMAQMATLRITLLAVTVASRKAEKNSASTT
ncbi:hypothetical protein LAZ67_2006230 [Cordylochernes scorpioides]|uniref:Uncharacterized protein n=1 Tax=Cordylochernes scorpioides TaxID=51811 RepID=A0ABY6K9P2_9ARAC|nr:hypothetical protein LAZ67_2006230 [Cordylochernes scorpioides]